MSGNGIMSINRQSGGARRDRTDDLLLAKQALSQLSYGPAGAQRSDDGRQKSALASSVVAMLCVLLVGLGRFELPASRLSSARSNQLSYKPEIFKILRTGSRSARHAGD